MNTRPLTEDEALTIGRELTRACEGRFASIAWRTTGLDLRPVEQPLAGTLDYQLQFDTGGPDLPAWLCQLVGTRGYGLRRVMTDDDGDAFSTEGTWQIVVPEVVADWYADYIAREGVPEAPPKTRYVGTNANGGTTYSNRVDYDEAESIPHPVLDGSISPEEVGL